MSSPDNSFLSDTLTRSPRRKTLKEQWWHIMDNWKVGIIPLPLFVLAGALIAVDCLSGTLKSDIVVMVATLAFFGFACGEFGKRLPVVGRLGQRLSAPPLFLLRWCTTVCFPTSW